VFGELSAGSAFTVYAPGEYSSAHSGSKNNYEKMRSWNYAVKAGETVQDEWPLCNFKDGRYHLQVHGPNGFLREFGGDRKDPLLRVFCYYQHSDRNRNELTGNIALRFENKDRRSQKVAITDNGYGERR